MVAAPPAAIKISPLTLPNISSSKLLNVIFCEPSSVSSTITTKSAWAIVVSVPNSFKSKDKLCAIPSPEVAPLESIPVPPVIVAT